MGPKTCRRCFRSHSLSKPANHTFRVTNFNRHVTRIADLIIVKAKPQRNSIGPMLYNLLGHRGPTNRKLVGLLRLNIGQLHKFDIAADRHCHSARRANEAALVIS